ncbi:MAG: HAD family phosphatase [Clostridiales bacterium]|nr:HAD family phosphatase [Clostridiales bacterium]
MIKAVIFDLDGLLVDTELIAYQIYKDILEKYGYQFTKEEYSQNYSGKSMTVNVPHVIETYQLPWTVEKGLEEVLRAEERLLTYGVELKPGARELLAFLKENQYKIAMASSSIRDRALNILRENGIVDYFGQFVFGKEVEKGKPYPDIFLKACEKLGERPENCLVLEDSEAGIQAANAAGIPVICVPDMKRPSQQLLDRATAVLDSLDQVIPYLSGEG